LKNKKTNSSKNNEFIPKHCVVFASL